MESTLRLPLTILLMQSIKSHSEALLQSYITTAACGCTAFATCMAHSKRAHGSNEAATHATGTERGRLSHTSRAWWTRDEMRTRRSYCGITAGRYGEQ